MQNSQPGGEEPSYQRLVEGYARQAGQSDEMLGADGAIKPPWRQFIDHLAGLTPDQLGRRFARGDQYLRDAGVLYRQYDDAASEEREWPLSHIPVILGEAEWQAISAALIQRADLLEMVVRDLYGPNTLVANGQLPGTLLSQNPAWLRPMIGVEPAAGNFLNLLSFEIGRGPDGKWWVISDLVEAPSTAGFAIENRVAMSKVFPNYYSGAYIHRLATFFQTLQRSLFDLRGRTKGQIAVMSPGPGHQNYAEHAYIARYMGMLLVEGEDLIVQDGKVMVRTVAGPRPLSLLWNRVPSTMSDPLELDPSSVIGTPGLIEALRAGRLNTVNAVGAGVLETRALMAFLPKIARALLGQPLMMPNIATWWCGQQSQRDHVVAHRDRMMVGSAFSTTPLMSDAGATVLASEYGADNGGTLAQRLEQDGRELVGQEAITLSTTPSYEDGALVARPMCVRLFVARTPNGWQVMPGGYARVSAGSDAKAFAMQRGGKVADVWVVSDTPVHNASLFGAGSLAERRQSSRNALPSRTADNLFWLGRYVERAEHNMRLFRAYFARINDGVSHDDPLMRHMRTTILDGVEPTAAAMAARFSRPLTHGFRSATKIGDRFSPDGMMALRALVDACRDLDQRSVPTEEIPREVSVLLRQVTGFAGLVHENMYRSDGWRFLSLGISLERAANMSKLLAHLAGPDAPEGALDLALEVADSVVSYRLRFSILANSASIIDLLGIDDQNPRAIRYHIARARQHIAELPGQDEQHVLTEAARKTLMLDTLLATHPVDGFTPDFLTQVQRDIWQIADALSAAHLV